MEHLYLSGNELTEIRGDEWQGLDSLQNLGLEHMDICTVPNGAFASIRSLKRVFFDYFQTLQAEAFDLENQVVGLRGVVKCDPRMCWLVEAVARKGWNAKYLKCLKYYECRDTFKWAYLDCD